MSVALALTLTLQVKRVRHHGTGDLFAAKILDKRGPGNVGVGMIRLGLGLGLGLGLQPGL